MTSTQPWPVVLADLDGTLADSVPLIIASYQQVFRALLGRDVPTAEARRWIGRTLIDVFVEEAPDHARALEAAYLEWNHEHIDLIGGFDGVPELCRDVVAAGIEFGIVTSKRRSVAERTMVLADVADFPLIGAMEDSPLHKPNPAPLLVALEAIGRGPSESVYIGDATVDVLAARAAGMASIAVTWGAGERDDLAACKPDHLVDTVDELRAVLLG